MPELKPEFTRFDAPRHPQAAEKEAYVERMFDEISPTYDLANRLMSFGVDRLWRRRLVREAAVPAGGSVLDLCCGTGDVLFEFGRRLPGVKGVGLDFSEQMLVRARAKDKAGFTWVRGSALELPFEPGGFDACSMAYGLRSITDPVRSFREMARVLKPGGRALCLELTRPRNALAKLCYWPVLNVYVPVLGGLLSGNKEGYRYLRDSIRQFYEPGTVLGFMRDAGLGDVRAIPLTLGSATLFVGLKP
jgi:demethylmenaquinone methyltransferase/2-methoxy-6-polyprenyl-1,4-benzoquinol methylase